MKLTFKDSKTSTSVYCGKYKLGVIQINFTVRREKATEFTGMGTTFFYDSLEDAKTKLENDLIAYFKELYNYGEGNDFDN